MKPKEKAIKINDLLNIQAKKIFDDLVITNELCPICLKWYNLWIKELKQKHLNKVKE